MIRFPLGAPVLNLAAHCTLSLFQRKKIAQRMGRSATWWRIPTAKDMVAWLTEQGAEWAWQAPIHRWTRFTLLVTTGRRAV